MGAVKMNSKGQEVADRNVRFRKRVISSVSVLMQKAQRNAFTGEITMKDLIGYPDFLLVDVAMRPNGYLQGGLNELMADKYLFKPVPLMYRTWIYHCMVKEGAVLNGKHDESGLLKSVLSHFCIDAPTNAGLTSPLVYYVPLALGTCLTGNTILVIITLGVLAVMVTIAKGTNTRTNYRMGRVSSLPVRMVYFAVVLAFLDFSNFASILGFCLTIVFALVDFIQGDVAALLGYKLHCSYHVLQALEGRLYVCFREGAMAWEEMFGDRGVVPEDVSNLAAWEKRHHLIADIGDLLVELRPLTADDWEALRERYLVGSEPIPYLAIDAFDLNPSGQSAAVSKILAFTRNQEEGSEAPEDMVLEDF